MSFAWLYLLGVLITIYAADFKCPSAQQWRLRAQSFCGKEEKYTCLYYIDEYEETYKEQCNGPRRESPGEKTEINNGNFNNVDCSQDRYQPILFSTTQGSECLYLKSNCSEEGQVVYSNGSTTEDRTCGCNYEQQYAFVSQNLTNPCFCIPSVEDCTCYKKTCDFGHRLSPDYQCVTKNKTGGKYNCKEIASIDVEEEEKTIILNKHGNQTTSTLSVRDRQNIETFISIICCIVLVIGSCVFVLKCRSKIDDFINQYFRKVYVTCYLPEQISCVQGDTCILECDMSKINLPVSWYKDDEPLSDKQNMEQRVEGHRLSLYIKHMSEKHQGNYELRYKEQTLTNTAVMFKSCVLTHPPVTVACVDGNKCSLQCEILIMNLAVQWYKNKQRLPSSDNIRHICEGHRHSLTIVKMSEEDAGTYELRYRDQILTTTHVQFIHDEKKKAKYKENIRTNKEKRLYIRVMIVGKHGVGKSSLLRRLLNEGIKGVESTDGIDIVVRRCKIRQWDGKWIFDQAQDPKKEYATRIKRALQKQNVEYDINNEPDPSTSVVGQQETYQDSPDHSISTVVKTETYSHNTSLSDIQTTEQQNEVKLSAKKEDTPLTHHSETIIQDQGINDTQEQENVGQFADTLTAKISTNKVTKVLTDTVERELDYFLSHIEQYEDENEVYVEIGFWDFAGEKDYYGTHHTFLDSNALYLLVTDCSEDLRQMEPCVTYDSIGNYIDFWFDAIHNCRDAEGETTGTQLDPPVILVCTGLDKLTGKVDEEKDTFLLKLKDAIQDGRKQNHLRKVCFVSNTEPSESDFNLVRDLIFEYGKQLQSYGKELPLKWIRLEQSLDVLRESGYNIIARDDVLGLARKCDIEETGEVEKFLLHQHQMGSIIYCEDIKNYVILKQQWLADAFKCVVSDKIDYDVKMTDNWVLLLKTGILDLSLLEQLFEKKHELDFNKYQDHILQVFIKFDIIGRSNEQGKDIYYMPYMIKPEFSTSLQDIFSHFGVDKGHCRKTAWLCYEFEFFPISFFIYVMLYFIKTYEICFDSNLNKRSIYHGVGVYFLDSKRDHKLIVVFCKSTVAFQIWHWEVFPKHKYRTFLIGVKKVLDKLKTKYKAKHIRYYVRVKCSEGDVNSKTGRMSYQDFKQKSKDGRYFCDEHNIKHDSTKLLDTWFHNYQNLPIKFHQRCTTCNSEPSVYWCFECNTSLCENCNSKHQESVDHHVQHVQDKYALDYTFNVNDGFIGDIKLVSEGLLCVADFIREQLVTVDITSRKQQSIPLPGKPLCITVVDNSTVAVTLYNSTKVVIVDIRQSHIIKHIDVKEVCRGIMYSNNQLFVGCEDNTINVLSMSGKITNTIQLSFTPRYIYGSDDGSIYCIDWSKLYCIDTEGNILFTFTHPDMDIPLSITTDDTGHVLVLCRRSNNILSISPDGKQCQVIVKHIPHIHVPCICYIPQSKSLVVGSGQNIDVYKLWNVD